MERKYGIASGHVDTPDETAVSKLAAHQKNLVVETWNLVFLDQRDVSPRAETRGKGSVHRLTL